MHGASCPDESEKLESCDNEEQSVYSCGSDVGCRCGPIAPTPSLLSGASRLSEATHHQADVLHRHGGGRGAFGVAHYTDL